MAVPPGAHAYHPGVGGPRDPATRFVIALVTVGFLGMLVVAASGTAIVRQLAEAQAIAQARTLTHLDATKVENQLTSGMLRRSGEGVNPRLDALVEQVVQPRPAGPVVRVKIWQPNGSTGTIIYSDVPQLVNLTEPLEDQQIEALQSGGAFAELSELDRQEHQYEHGLGPLTEVYTRIGKPGGGKLLFETYQRSALITNASREIAGSFTPVLIITLLCAAGLELLLAGALIRRFRRGQREREALMRDVLEASFRERRIIAGDLHDGPVQEMSGLSLGLTAEAESAADEKTRQTLRRAAGSVRNSVRALRSAIVGIYPPNLEQTGLEAALTDLLARLPSREISGHLSYELVHELDHRASELLYRSSQEAIRNVEKHACATNVWVLVQQLNGGVTLRVTDDGRGGATVNDQIGESGRFGLAVLADIVRDAGGRMQVASDTGGTTLKVEVPV
jgi:two-component system, NarL family, sensor kinase